jgi:hypothetical protein
MLYNKPVKDVYDISSWGGNLSMSYEGCNIGENTSGVYFSQESGLGSMNIEYCKTVMNSSCVFGSVSVRNGKYVILNKEYSKEDYFEIVEKIKKHMNDIPYVDKSGKIYKYGEFFPMEISPFPYNKTLAQNFKILSKEEIDQQGMIFKEDITNNHEISLNWSELEDDINKTDESILKEIISCEECTKGYRITLAEFSFLQKMKLPIPRECPFCRIDKKLNLWVDNMLLKNRTCDKCKISFNTHYSKERSPIVCCKSCYQQEIY